MRQVFGYVLMLLRAYTRDFTALFFGFFFPLIFMGLFGILNFGAFGHVAVGIVDEANNAESQAFRAGLNLKYVDFLTPGIVGMTIMQLGVASVMFSFVVDRQRGVIRRIMATPISRRNYMAAHVLERLLLAVVQVLILLAVAVFAFKVSIVGRLGRVLANAILGSLQVLSLAD